MADTSVQSPIPRADASSRLVTRQALRAGLGIGAVCVLWTVGLHLTGNNGFGPKQLLAQLLVPLVALANEWWLRQSLKPEKPGLARSLGVGVLTVLLAAVLTAGGVLGLAYGAGEPALARNRAEVTEIVRAQQQENPKVKITAQEARQQQQNVANLTAERLAGGTFMQVLLLGLVLALPGGIFFRE